MCNAVKIIGLRSLVSTPVAQPKQAVTDGAETSIKKRNKSRKKLSRRPRFSKRFLPKLQPKADEEYYNSPKQMKTNLIDFLERRDMHQRSKVINIPYFTSGSVMAVVKSDPHLKRGSTR